MIGFRKACHDFAWFVTNPYNFYTDARWAPAPPEVARALKNYGETLLTLGKHILEGQPKRFISLRDQVDLSRAPDRLRGPEHFL